MKKIISVLVILAVCVSLTACGGENAIVGTWHTTDIGVNIDSPEIPDYFSVIFAPDGTGRGPMGSFDMLDTVTFTYTVEEDVIRVVTSSDKIIDIEYSFEGDKLILEWDGYTRTCEKYSDDVIIEWH